MLPAAEPSLNDASVVSVAHIVTAISHVYLSTAPEAEASVCANVDSVPIEPYPLSDLSDGVSSLVDARASTIQLQGKISGVRDSMQLTRTQAILPPEVPSPLTALQWLQARGLTGTLPARCALRWFNLGLVLCDIT